MTESNARKDLERRLEQAKRMAALPVDPLTKERLQRLVQELEEQLRLSGRRPRLRIRRVITVAMRSNKRVIQCCRLRDGPFATLIQLQPQGWHPR